MEQRGPVAQGAPVKRAQRGFTLLEVTVALGIAAALAIMTSQVLRQRLAVQQSVQQHRLGVLCARELQARFAVERFWPLQSSVAGQLQQGDAHCHWQLQLTSTGVRNLRRGELRLFAERDGRDPLGQYRIFLVRP